MPNPRIAVVAIHGVGDHQPSEMANGVADLLADLKDGPRKPRYQAFLERKVRMNVAPVKVEGHAFSGAAQVNKGKPIAQSKTWGPMDALYKSKRPIEHAAKAETESLDHLFMEGQLAEYKGAGPEETYEALCLEGKRYANAPIGREESATAPQRAAPETEVHVYDMFWSDLSGVNTAGLRIFGELYQLLFHLGSVGVNNVKAAAIFFKDTSAEPAWARFDQMQVRAAAMLAWPIPFLNLIILGLALGLFADSALVKLTGLEEFSTTMVVAFAGITGWIGSALWRQGNFTLAAFRRPMIWFLILASLAALAAIGADKLWGTFSDPLVREIVELAATFLVWLAAAAALWAVLNAYEKRRPGSWLAFRRTLIPFAIFGLIVGALDHPPVQQTSFIAMVISLKFIESAFWVLLFSWLIFWFYLIRAFFAGRAAVRAAGAAKPAELDRARRTNWTARLTIALPAVLFLLLTVAAWAGIVKVSRNLLPHDPSIGQFNCPAWNLRDMPPNHVNALCYRSITAALVKSNSLPVGDWAQDALHTAGLGHFPLLLLLVCFGAAITIWAVAPSVKDEVSPPHGPEANSPAKSATLGEWLDNGFGFMRWAGRLLYLGIVLFPGAIVFALISAVLPYNQVIEGVKNATLPFELSLGGLVAGATVTVLGLGGRLSKLALGFRPIVRVALDVDNWLREHPRDSNPTAKICGRYVSLLRYIAQWRGPDNRGYDALIVFAHSQGTVISADLLRFLQVEAAAANGYAKYDHTLAAFDTMPVYLFTMGCPLRQLYGLRFPYLYGYAPSGSANSPLPKPEDLGVREWVNAYRTGDYVGRYLWRDEPWLPVGTISFNTWDPPNGIPGNIWVDKSRTRVELCIGPGAHTHYWDETAAAIAETLDVLIAKCGAGSYPAAAS